MPLLKVPGLLTSECQSRMYCDPLRFCHCQSAWVELAGAGTDVEACVHIQPDRLCKTDEACVESAKGCCHNGYGRDKKATFKISHHWVIQLQGHNRCQGSTTLSCHHDKAARFEEGFRQGVILGSPKALLVPTPVCRQA